LRAPGPITEPAMPCLTCLGPAVARSGTIPDRRGPSRSPSQWGRAPSGSLTEMEVRILAHGPSLCAPWCWCQAHSIQGASWPCKAIGQGHDLVLTSCDHTDPASKWARHSWAPGHDETVRDSSILLTRVHIRRSVEAEHKLYARYSNQCHTPLLARPAMQLTLTRLPGQISTLMGPSSFRLVV